VIDSGSGVTAVTSVIVTAASAAGG
jgi:hypothetical protein